MSEPEYDTSGPSLKLVFGIVGTLAVLLGVLSYWRFAKSERWVAEGRAHMEAVGGDRDIHGCLDEVVSWHDRCEDEGVNAAVCLQAVKIQTYHCLAARDREQECTTATVSSEVEGTWDQRREDGKWVYDVCIARNQTCKIKKECACAVGVRAVESFCLNDGRAVEL